MAKILFFSLYCSVILTFVHSRGEDLFPVLDKYCRKKLSTKAKESIMKCENDFDPKLFEPVRDCVKLVKNFDVIPMATICYLSHYKNPKSYKQIETCINEHFKLNPFDMEKSNEEMEKFVDCLKKLPIKKKKSQQNPNEEKLS